MDWDHVSIMKVDNSMSVSVKMEQCSLELAVMELSHVLV